MTREMGEVVRLASKNGISLLMKTQLKALFGCVVLLAALSAPHLASAYYDPGVQRWINRDPIQEVMGPNLYAFVYNAPEGLVDTFGHSIDNDCFALCPAHFLQCAA